MCARLRGRRRRHSGGSSAGPSAAAAPPSGAGALDGTYVGNRLEPGTAGAVVEVIETTVTVTISEGEANGHIEHVVVVVTNDAGRTITQHATQTIDFEGAASADGTFEGAGRTRVSYVLISCAPEEQCDGVTATTSVADGVAVTLTGTVRDGVLSVEILNSVSGATSTFEARREP